MGINKDIIMNCAIGMVQWINTDTFVIEFVKLDSYHNCMDIIIDAFQFPKYDGMKISEIVDNINNNIFFPSDFKIKFIVELLKDQYWGRSKEFDIVMSISPLCEIRNTSKIYIYEIFDIYLDDDMVHGKKTMIKRIRYPYLTYLGTKPVITMEYDIDKLEILEFKVNDKIIPLINHKKTFTKGTLGANVMVTILTHIAKVLLKMETI